MLHIQIVKFLQSNSMAAVITFYISVYIYIICMKNGVNRESSDEKYNREICSNGINCVIKVL